MLSLKQLVHEIHCRSIWQVLAIHGVASWRNALLGGMVAFALWGMVATVWVLRGQGLGTEGGPVGVPTPSIAVLPFQNLSDDPEAEPFTSGVHDDLLTRLAKIGNLNIISWTSVNPDEAVRSGNEPFNIGVAYATLGDQDSAFEWMARSAWDRVVARWLLYHPALDPLRPDARFEAVVEGMERTGGLR